VKASAWVNKQLALPSGNHEENDKA